MKMALSIATDSNGSVMPVLSLLPERDPDVLFCRSLFERFEESATVVLPPYDPKKWLHLDISNVMAQLNLKPLDFKIADFGTSAPPPEPVDLGE